MRENWEAPYKSRYGPTAIPPTSALLSMKSTQTGKLAMMETFYAMSDWSEERYLKAKAYACLGLAYTCLLLKEFDEAEEHYTTFMNVLLAYFNADHEDPVHSLFVFQRTLKSGHTSFFVAKYDLSGQRPCLTVLNRFLNIEDNPSLAAGIKSMVPLVMSKFFRRKFIT